MVEEETERIVLKASLKKETKFILYNSGSTLSTKIFKCMKCTQSSFS